MADLTPLWVGGDDAQDVDDPSKAVAQLQELGRQQWPTETEAIQFMRAFESRPDLAAKAHRRPGPTTSYPFPK